MIHLQCAICGHSFAAAEEAAGGQVACPACGGVQTVPASGGSAWPGGGAPGQGGAGGSPFAAAASPYASAELRDEANPYAAPIGHADYLGGPAFGAAAGQIVPTPLDIGDVFSRAWPIFQANLLNTIGACVVVFAINFVVGLVLGGVGQAAILLGGDQNIAVFVVSQIAQQIISTSISLWLMAGLFRFYLDLGGGRPARFADVFSGARYLLRLLLLALLFYLAAAVVVAGALGPGFGAAFALGGSHPATIGLFVGGALALLVFFLYVGLGVSQYMFALIDQDCDVLKSLRISWLIMRGNRLSFFALALLVGLLGMAGVLACLVGAIFTVPLGYFLIAIAYLRMTGQPTAETMYRAPA